MFENYTEQARRTIFFARYETSVFGGEYIETEHFLLGLLREDEALRPRMNHEKVRRRIEEKTPPGKPSSTSVDIPLSKECQNVLAYAAEESERLGHKFIDTGHLLLGLLRIEKSFAAELLREYGFNLDEYRETVRDTARAPKRSEPDRWEPAERLLERAEPLYRVVSAQSIEPAVRRLEDLLAGTCAHVDRYSELYGLQKLKRRRWTRKQALGHLIGLAEAHHQWLASALAQGAVNVNVIPSEDWLATQNYDGIAWTDLLDLWVGLNRVLIHVLAQAPEEKLNVPVAIGVQPPAPISKIVEDYVTVCEDIAGQICSRL